MTRHLFAVLAILVLAGAAGAADRATSGSRDPGASSGSGMPGATAPVVVEGLWRGHYSYPEDRNPPVPFELRVTSSRPGAFTGRTSEPNTFGDPGVQALFGNVEGAVDPGGEVRFTKTYDGTGGVSHTIHYLAQLSEDGRAMTGMWAIAGNWDGRFELRRTE